MAPDEITETALITVSSWQRKGTGMDYTDIDPDGCALRSLKRDLPPVAYVEEDSLLHYILQTLGWKEEHSVDASVPDGPYIKFIKMINPNKKGK